MPTPDETLWGRFNMSKHTPQLGEFQSQPHLPCVRVRHTPPFDGFVPSHLLARYTKHTGFYGLALGGGGVRPPERRSIVQASRQSGAAATSKHVLVTISI